MVLIPNADLSDVLVDDTNLDHDSLMGKYLVVGKKRKKRNYMRRNYPKKALSAYNIFFKETREKILTEYGKTNFQEMVRKIAALWKEITPEEKIRFDRIADSHLARYKEEVCEYEWKIIENNRKKLHAEEEKKKQAIVDADTRSQQENNGIKKRKLSLVKNDQIAENLCNDMVARSVQVVSKNSTSDYYLTSNELQLAQRRLNEELNSIEEPRTPTEKKFYQHNFKSMDFDGNHRMMSGEADDSIGLVPASVSYELELRKKLGIGTGSIAALNKTRLEHNFNKKGNDPTIALEEGAIRNMVRQSQMQFGLSRTRGDGGRILLNRHASEINGKQIQTYLNHHGNQIEQLNGIVSALKRGNAVEIKKALGLRSQNSLSMNSIRNHYSASDAELQKHLTMMQEEKKSISRQLGQSLAIVRRQQEILRRQERYMNQLNCVALPSSHGRPVVNLSILGDSRVHPLSDALDLSD